MRKLFTCLAIFAAINIIAQDTNSNGKMDELNLPDGRILKHPYIMNKTPNGVVVAHDEGAKFIKYKDMPPEIAKKLSYKPQKAKKYEKKLKKYHQQEAAKKAKEAEAKKKYDAQYKVRMQKYKITELEKKIQQYKIRIKRLEYEIPRLEKERDKLRNEAVNLSQPSGNSSGTYFWRGGFVSNNSSRRSENRKRYKVVKSLGDGFSKTSFRLEDYKDELEKKILELDQMEKHLAELKKKNGKKSGFLSNLF
ncbi:MAG: hypothetical protein GY750_09080 [Lentisphaerae bacterium]|nr:hypothetical protein [Lentisphaerota bacterium]MCP4101564.1 hypothetical protein [Lentisphaerota bacterium]